MAFIKFCFVQWWIVAVCLFLSLHIISAQTKDLATEMTPSSIDLTKSILMDESSVASLLLSNSSTLSSSSLTTEISADVPSNDNASIPADSKEIQHSDNIQIETTTADNSTSFVQEDKLNSSTNSSHSLPTSHISTTTANILPPTILSNDNNDTNKLTTQDTSTNGTNGTVGEITDTKESDTMVLQQNNLTKIFDLVSTDTNNPKDTESPLLNQTSHTEEIEHETPINQTVTSDNSTASSIQANIKTSSYTSNTNETWLNEPSSAFVIGVNSPNESAVIEFNDSAITHSISDSQSAVTETSTNDSSTQFKTESITMMAVSTTSSTPEPIEPSTKEEAESTTLILQTEILISNTALTDTTPLLTTSANLFQSWFVFHFNCNCTPDQSFYTKFEKELREKLALKTGIPSSELSLKPVNCSHNFRINITINSEYEDNMTGYLKEIQGSKDPFILVNGQKLFLEYATGGPGEYHPHPQVILSERHTDIEFVIYVALGSACAFLLTLAVVLVLCKYCQGKPYKGFDLNDTSHLSLRLEDYTLTQIPRAKSIYIDYCRPVGSEHYSPLDEQSVNSSGLVRSFDTSIVPLEDAPTDLPETNTEKKPTSNTKEMYLFTNEAKPSPHHEYEEIDVTSVKSTENLNVQSGEKKSQWGVDNAMFTT